MNNGKICVPVCAVTVEEFIADMKRAAELADVIELRFDYLDNIELKALRAPISELKKIFPGKLLATYRGQDQGGSRQITLPERLKFWLGSKIEKLVHWADFEYDLQPDGWNSYPLESYERTIRSFHDFNRVPKNLEDIYSNLSQITDYERESGESDYIKIAVSPSDITCSLPLWELLKRAKEEDVGLIPIAMGEAGKWTRIMGPAFGVPVTYASLETGRENAPGQIPVKDMIELYRVKELSEETRVFGVIGDPVSKSLSPYMHNPAFQAKGLDAVFMHLQVRHLHSFITEFIPQSGLNFGGLSVTMPHKQAIIPYLDEIDKTAKTIGAVNTVKIVDGKLHGFNTDADGFIGPLKKAFGDLKGARVALLGAGGVARACVYVLKRAGAEVTVFVRNTGRGQDFAREFGVKLGKLPASSLDGFDIAVNATPHGMKPGEEDFTLLTADQLGSVKLVFDLITKPAETALMREAKKAGVPTIGGVEMLIAQGIKQFQIWTGTGAPADLMREKVIERLFD